MDQISKIKVLDVLSVCRIRHESEDCKCKDCMFYGQDCVNAHKFAESAVRIIKVKEVTDGRSIKD